MNIKKTTVKYIIIYQLTTKNNQTTFLKVHITFKEITIKIKTIKINRNNKIQKIVE